MNKTVFKIFGIFVLSASFIATLLMLINFFGFAIIGSDIDSAGGTAPKRILQTISEQLVQDAGGFHLKDRSALPEEHWCILIDESGHVIWSEKKPEDVPDQYSINDIARMTRWFLKDYPVYVQTEDYGLLVLGKPKNSVGKYTMDYSMNWFSTLPQRILGIFLLNLCLAACLAFVFGLKLYRQLKKLMNGVSDL